MATMQSVFVGLVNKSILFFYPLFRKFMTLQVFAYLFVGAANTFLNIAIFLVFNIFIITSPMMVSGLGSIQPYTINLLIAFMLTVPSGYFLAGTFAFQSLEKRNHKIGMMKYFLVVLQGLALDYLFMKAGIEFLGLNSNIAKIISTVIVLTINYLLQKYFTFREKKPSA